MADDSGQPKGPSKAGETTLALIGSLAGIAGKLAFGPDFDADLGAPFKAGADMLAQRRQEKGLLQLLNSTPHTAPLAQAVPALIGAGGIANNSDLLSHPEVQSMFPSGSGQAPSQPQQDLTQVPMEQLMQMNIIPASAPQQSQGPIQSPVPSPSGQLLNTLQPQQPERIDFQSPEFLRKAAIYRPDIAQALLMEQAKRSPDDELHKKLQDILLGKQINNFQTKEETRAAALQDKKDLADYNRDLINAGQTNQKEIAQKLQKEKITPKEEEGFNNVDELRRNYQSILQDLDSGINPSFTKNAIATLLPYGDNIMQIADPKFSLMKKNVDLSNALHQKSISGAVISEPEAKRLRPTQPQAGDSPAIFKTLTENNLKKANELYLIKGLNAANRGGKVDEYIPMDKLLKYKAIRAAMNADLAGALKSPQITAARKELGIDYGADNVEE